MADDHTQEAQREVDELTPGSDPIASSANPDNPDALGRPLDPSDPQFIALVPRDEPERLVDVDITREEVLAANDHRVITVAVDEWKKGAKVYIHTVSAADKDHLEQTLLKATEKDSDGNPIRKRVGEDEVRAYFIAMCTRNSKGQRIFQADDITALKQKSVVVMDRIYTAILDASIITKNDVEDMAKNSGAASTGTSS
jgi:hypothetical protein